MTRRAGLVLLASISALLSSCSSNPQQQTADTLRHALHRTAGEARHFDYSYQGDGPAVRVQGLVEDDARYQADLTIDRVPVLQEVASDDLLADQFRQPGSLGLLLRATSTGDQATAPAPVGGTATATPTSTLGPAAARATSTTPAQRAATMAALRAGRWVVDALGAPDLLSATNDEFRRQGEDPIVDALSALTYVESVIRLQPFKEFNADDLDYDPKQDHFPQATAGITRYDSLQPSLPTAAQITGSGGRSVLPDAASFRKMSLYLDKSGRLVGIREEIDVASRVRELLQRTKLPIPKGLSDQELAVAAVKALNELRTAAGDAPIVVHSMTLLLSDIGTDLRVSVPTKGVVKGDLSLLTNRGRLGNAVPVLAVPGR